MRHRPNYTVLVVVVVLMVMLAFVATGLKPLIPSPPPNYIATYPGDYLARAAGQRIEWRPLDPNVFAEARRLDRPVIVLVGVAWSRAAREFDTDVLSGTDVQNYLTHNFICVRIDGGEMPAWISAYLPLSRVAAGIRPRFQIWVLEPNGKLLVNIGRRRPETIFDQNGFLNELVKVRRAYAALRQANDSSATEIQQQRDIRQIEALGSSPAPDFRAFRVAMVSAIDARHGGFPVFGFQDLRPWAWSFLAMTGQDAALRTSLLPVLRSRTADLVDGGFFSGARQIDWGNNDFDKIAVQNAEMLWALCLTRAQLPTEHSLLDFHIDGTSASLAGEFRNENGLIRSARIGDQQDRNRNPRSSFSPLKMRAALTPAEREIARNELGLRVETNPEMVPYLSAQAQPNDLDAILAALREHAGTAKFSTGLYMDVNATVAARLMESGRALGDQALMDVGSDLFSRTDLDRVDDQVPHDLVVAGRSPATLLDYLSYADAALQDYLTTGRVVSLDHGRAVLQRGLTTFAGAYPGEYNVGLKPSSDLIPADSAGPQVIDDVGESASAKVVRVCTAYGRLLLQNGLEDDPGLRLLRIAYATEVLFSDPVSVLGAPCAAFACSAASVADDAYAFTVGPDAADLANRLFALRPTRFIAPCFGPVRPDLRNRAPGIYVVHADSEEGPFSVEQAADRLPLTLRIF